MSECELTETVMDRVPDAAVSASEENPSGFCVFNSKVYIFKPILSLDGNSER